MLWIIIIYKLIRNKGKIPSFSKDMLNPLLARVKYVIFPVLFLLLNSSMTKFNEPITSEKIEFSIIKKNSIIGFIYIDKISKDHTTSYNVKSEVNAKIIVNFKAIGQEKYVFRNDTLVSSSMYRKINNRVKLDQSLQYKKGKYELTARNKKEVLGIDLIQRNLVTLFFNEPKDLETIYCDKFKTEVNISPLGKGRYKILLPNKSYSIYNYERGKCTSIEVKGTFFKVKLVQEKKSGDYANYDLNHRIINKESSN